MNPTSRDILQKIGKLRAISRRERETTKAKRRRTMTPVKRSTITIAEDLRREWEYRDPSLIRTTSPPNRVGKKRLKKLPTRYDLAKKPKGTSSP